MRVFALESIGTVLRRGWKRRCPRCGEGPLFRRGITAHDRCSACNLLYQKDYGDAWMFMVITDRIPMLIGIAILYFGFRPDNWVSNGIFLAALATPMLATIRQRQGVALALDYLFRRHANDPNDRV